MTVSARLIAVSRPLDDRLTAEGLIEHCARVSSPERQEAALDGQAERGRLLAYLMRHAHWSPLEMVTATVEVEAPRDIARQLLRHRSFSFQEFSQRYAEAPGFCVRFARRQDDTNRQASHDDLSDATMDKWDEMRARVLNAVESAYHEALSLGIAKECARVLLPEGLTLSRLYVQGSIRSWFHYLAVREEEGTQLEHRELARCIREALAPEFPTLFAPEAAQ